MRVTQPALQSLVLIAVVLSRAAHADDADTHEVTIYGATVAGVAAAIEAKNHGHSVIVLEPGKHIGGLTSGGLGATDIGNKAAIGGLAREFYRRLGQRSILVGRDHPT